MVTGWLSYYGMVWRVAKPTKSNEKYQLLKYVCSSTICSGQTCFRSLDDGREQCIVPIFRKGKFDPAVTKIAAEIRRCGSSKTVLEGKKIHDHVIKCGLNQDRFLNNLLIQMYGKFGVMGAARTVFEEMPDRNSFSWNLLIGAYLQHGHFEEALMLFKRMQRKDVVAYNTMISAYACRGNLKEALQLFEDMPEPDVVSWTTMITGYTQQGQLDEALELFERMPARDIVSSTAMITAFAQHGEMVRAFQVFEQMPEKDVVSWNAMISGYARVGQLNDALQLFQEMRLNGMMPDKVTYICMLDACGSQAALDEGKQMHMLIMRSGFDTDTMVSNSLISMYGKCGNLYDACSVFDRMSEQVLVTWNAMIAAYAQHGHVDESLKLLTSMSLNGVMPCEVTFLSILSSFRHAGLMDEGCHNVVCMSLDHGVRPTMEHYNSLLDILGRIGRLNVAEAFLNNLSLRPDATSWATVLGWCTTFSDMERGKRVAERLFELDPENPAVYISLSNIFAVAGSAPLGTQTQKTYCT